MLIIEKNVPIFATCKSTLSLENENKVFIRNTEFSSYVNCHKFVS